MKVVIFGSKGFIGHNLFNYLCEKDYDVWSSDIVNCSVNTKKHFLVNANSTDFDFVFQQQTYDLCINCSGASNVPDSLIDPQGDYYLNTLNVFKILDSIRRFQPFCRFINLSSAAVYGNPLRLPIKEDDDLKTLSPYGFHKFQAEQICKEFWSLFGIKACSIRIFSAYGPGLRKQIFWDLYKKIKTGEPFSLYGTGNESRDFIYVRDVVRAIDLVSKFSTFEADVINVANGEEIMIKDAVSVFLRFFNYDVPYSFSGDARKGDPINWMADISKLTSFGYKPSVNLETGLQKVYNWISVNDFD